MSWVQLGRESGGGITSSLAWVNSRFVVSAVPLARPVRLLALLGFILVGYGAISVYERFLASRLSRQRATTSSL